MEEGNGGLTKVVLKHACGSSAEVYLFGGCVVSWKQPSGDEILYVRPDAVFNGVKPISGGIPHCFPQVLRVSLPTVTTVCTLNHSFLVTLE